MPSAFDDQHGEGLQVENIGPTLSSRAPTMSQNVQNMIFLELLLDPSQT